MPGCLAAQPAAVTGPHTWTSEAPRHCPRLRSPPRLLGVAARRPPMDRANRTPCSRQSGVEAGERGGVASRGTTRRSPAADAHRAPSARACRARALEPRDRLEAAGQPSGHHLSHREPVLEASGEQSGWAGRPRIRARPARPQPMAAHGRRAAAPSASCRAVWGPSR
jgi:hypothetical protein